MCYPLLSLKHACSCRRPKSMAIETWAASHTAHECAAAGHRPAPIWFPASLLSQRALSSHSHLVVYTLKSGDVTHRRPQGCTSRLPWLLALTKSARYVVPPAITRPLPCHPPSTYPVLYIPPAHTVAPRHHHDSPPSHTHPLTHRVTGGAAGGKGRSRRHHT